MGMKFDKKSNPQYRNLQKTSPENKQILIKTSPNSRENRKVGSTAERSLPTYSYAHPIKRRRLCRLPVLPLVGKNPYG